MRPLEIDDLLKEFHANFMKIFAAKDIEKVLDLYDENGMIVHRGGGVVYGRESKSSKKCLEIDVIF